MENREEMTWYVNWDGLHGLHTCSCEYEGVREEAGVRVEVSSIFSLIELEMRGGSNRNPSTFTRAVNSVFTFVRYAEFEILFVLFFLIAFIIFKDLVRLSILRVRPFNQILLWLYIYIVIIKMILLGSIKCRFNCTINLVLCLIVCQS